MSKEREAAACPGKSKKKLGILGGTFSPIHKGHVFLARFVKENCGLEKVILMPAGKPPHKLGEPIEAPRHRLAMARLAAEGIPGLEVSDLEMKKPDISYTYDTLTALRERFGDEWQLYFITGTDELLGFEGWYRAEELMKEFSFIVGVRPGYERENIQEKAESLRAKYGADILIVDLLAPDVSASEIRKRLYENKPVEDLLDEKVIRYIRKEGLYQSL